MEPNSKGQIVIPKQIRDDLGITSSTPLNLVVRDDGIHLYPIREISTTAETKMSHSRLLYVLERTRGLWADDKDFDKRQRQRRKIELVASRRRKKAWW